MIQVTWTYFTPSNETAGFFVDQDMLDSIAQDKAEENISMNPMCRILWDGGLVDLVPEFYEKLS